MIKLGKVLEAYPQHNSEVVNAIMEYMSDSKAIEEFLKKKNLDTATVDMFVEVTALVTPGLIKTRPTDSGSQRVKLSSKGFRIYTSH